MIEELRQICFIDNSWELAADDGLGELVTLLETALFKSV
jgi:hypothetical protein